ncbi:MAG: sigma-70 family RNA polymerase sigma factor [Corynebacterium sp.]|uniref:RNA polymerase sigma factor n=1 Tax=Corynebacterium sp. TaxID=1720 RepID=UPI0026DC0DD8|nr:sigma-70 family RNA polymerase sigma factor [Corynebacterium sp.]MDO5097258.1 sigma-70 family RNA polymerase sigma factor [Corynebacterium sp.]
MSIRTTDRRATFIATYNDDYPQVLAYLRRRSDYDHAAELAAEVFLRAWSKWEDAADPPLPWLYGIARNVLLEFYRKREQDQKLHRKAAACNTVIALSAVDAVVSRLDVLSALHELPESDQEVLTLHTWESLSPKEIAQVLHISPENARVRLHRARQRLAEKLKEPSDG